MTISINLRRVLLTSFLGTFIVFGLGLTTGCGAAVSNNKETISEMVDDGVNPVRRYKRTYEGRASGASVGLPFLGGLGGGAGMSVTAGYGNPVGGGGNLCGAHGRFCSGTIIVATPFIEPPFIAQSAGQPGYIPQGNNSALEGRVSNLEKKVEKNRQVLIRDHENRRVVEGYLGSLTVMPEYCKAIIANPESIHIGDAPELTIKVRAEVLTKCADQLSKKGKN